MVVRIDQARQQRAAVEIDDLGLARLSAKLAFVADRENLAALTASAATTGAPGSDGLSRRAG